MLEMEAANASMIFNLDPEYPSDAASNLKREFQKVLHYQQRELIEGYQELDA